MKLKFSLFCLVFLVGCGVNEAQLKSLTDTKSVLMYQHVEADRFRLLACPYKVDLEVASDCSNALFTAEGKEYYFSGVPKQPWLFAPSQESVEQLLTVPIITGGAVLTWFLLRKLRNKHGVDTVSKEIQTRLKPKTNAAAREVDIPKPDEAAQAAKQTEQLTAESYSNLASELEKTHDRYSHLFEKAKKISNNKRSSDAVDGVIDSTFNESNSDILKKIEAEKSFMDEQFAAIEKNIDDGIHDNIDFGWSVLNILKLNQSPPKPSEIFRDFKKMYAEGMTTMQASYKEQGEYSLKEASKIMGDLRAINNNIIDEFLGKFTLLIKQSDEQSDIFATIKQRQSNFRAKVHAEEKQMVQDNLETAADELGRGMTSLAGAIDYLIAGIGGLLAGSYLPDKLPVLEARLFTKKEWQKLFARDDSFKNPLRIPDSYRVVQKVARYLKRKGEKVVINEKVFFGLKN